MRLLHVTPSYLPAVRYGGPVFAVHGLCRSLVEAGHQVDVFTTRMDGPDDVPVESARRTDMEGVGVHYFDVRTPRRWFRSPGLADALTARVSNYDLIHIHALFLHPVSAASGAAWQAGVPYVVSPRGMLVRELFQRRSPVVKRCWMGLVGRRVLQRAAAIHVTSDGEARDATQFGLTLPPVLNVPNGVAGVSGDPAHDSRRDVLFIGRLTWKKGIERLVEAVALLEGHRLVIAGNDDEGLAASLAVLANRLGVADRVHFEGPVSARRRDELLAAAGVFVLASHSENFANTVLEAMACGCPVVVTPQVGLANAVISGRCGLVCDGTPAALAKAINDILSNPGRAAAMGEAGQALVRERFLWPRVAAEMLEGYRALLEVREHAA